MCNVLSLFFVGTYYFEYFCNSFLVAVKTIPLKFGLSLKIRIRISKGFALPPTSNSKSNLVFLVALQNGPGNVAGKKILQHIAKNNEKRGKKDRQIDKRTNLCFAMSMMLRISSFK